MSRSIRQDFSEFLGRVRVEQDVPEGQVISLQKHAHIVTIPDETFFDMLAEEDPRYERKAYKTVVASTTEDWAKYHLAKRALLTLKAYENTTGAEEVEVPCPKPKTHYEFLETPEEWLARCRALRAEQEAA